MYSTSFPYETVYTDRNGKTPTMLNSSFLTGGIKVCFEIKRQTHPRRPQQATASPLHT